MGELDNADFRKDGGTISRYVGSSLLKSLLVFDSADSVSVDMECLYGDTGMAFETPFSTNVGGGGRSLRPRGVSPSLSCC